jgi:hypothetical protein
LIAYAALRVIAYAALRVIAYAALRPGRLHAPGTFHGRDAAAIDPGG